MNKFESIIEKTYFLFKDRTYSIELGFDILKHITDTCNERKINNLLTNIKVPAFIKSVDEFFEYLIIRVNRANRVTTVLKDNYNTSTSALYKLLGITTYKSREEQFDRVFMNITKEISTLSRANRRKVGCIIVKDGNIIGLGFNGTPSGFDNDCEDENNLTKPEVLHAESNALMKACTSTQSTE